MASVLLKLSMNGFNFIAAHRDVEMATSEYWDQILLRSDFDVETAAEGPSIALLWTLQRRAICRLSRRFSTSDLQSLLMGTTAAAEFWMRERYGVAGTIGNDHT
jgi:hypothetical protein